MQNAVLKNQTTNSHPQTKPTPVSYEIAYLVSEYPALSHTFIANEIAELESRGNIIHPISVRRSKNPKASQGAFAKEASRTRYLLEAVPKALAPAVLGLAFKSPLGVLRMIKKTWVTLMKNRRPLKSIAYLAEAFVLIREMQRLGVSHVHNHFGNAAGNVVLIAAASGKIEYSLSIHGPDIFYNVEADCLAEKVENAAFTRCISHFSKSQLCLITKSTTWNRLHIVRCGVDSRKFDPSLKTNSKTVVQELLCVGRLVAAKGQRILLEAVKLLKARELNFHLTIVGAGPDEACLRKFAKLNDLDSLVTFTGGLQPSETLEYFLKSDVFVLPSFAEGIPVVLMEAMSLEIPVISTPVAGISELIEPSVSGALVPPGSAEALADCIGDYLVSPDAWGRLAAAGRTKVLEEFQQLKNGEEMNRLFSKHIS